MNVPKRPSEPFQRYGFAEGFRPGEHERAEATLDAMRRAGASFVRTPLDLTYSQEPEGAAWYDWLLPQIAARFELLPCIVDIGAGTSRPEHRSSAPLTLYADVAFLGQTLTRYGRHFSAVEIACRPGPSVDRSESADPRQSLVSACAGAVRLAQERGFATVLGKPGATDAQWLRGLGERGLLDEMTAVGIQGVLDAGSGENDGGESLNRIVAQTRQVLEAFSPGTEIWITQAGYSTWRHDEMTQARHFLSALAAPADRLYWHGWQEIACDTPNLESTGFRDRRDGMGAVDAVGQPKLLARLLMEGGVAKLRETVALARPSLAKGTQRIVIAGGAGFIGSNLAESFLREGRDVLLLDNLSRPGVEENVGWLTSRFGEKVTWQPGDVRDESVLADAIRDANAVFHLAAQVAVTTSIERPLQDFEVNARGTINLLEAVRRTGRKTPVIFASTNKVYGNLLDLEMREQRDRYVPADNEIAAHGIGEGRGLDFCTPYGCSKGVADQYVLDYAKSYDLPTAVLRMSCIYGPRQFGTEDQGWVAHFLIRALNGEPLTIYGDGKQVRDILHVTDAVAAYRAILGNIDRLKGQAFNLGGGPANAVSLRAVLDEIARLVGTNLKIEHSQTRQGDQTYFVADTRKLAQAVGWSARVGWMDGLGDLHAWLGGRNSRATKRSLGAATAPFERVVA